MENIENRKYGNSLLWSNSASLQGIITDKQRIEARKNLKQILLDWYVSKDVSENHVLRFEEDDRDMMGSRVVLTLGIYGSTDTGAKGAT